MRNNTQEKIWNDFMGLKINVFGHHSIREKVSALTKCPLYREFGYYFQQEMENQDNQSTSFSTNSLSIVLFAVTTPTWTSGHQKLETVIWKLHQKKKASAISLR